MNSFEVTGGKRLKGEIIPQGAKNEALQVISAVLLTKGKITISNIPDILDVNLLIEVLQEMGVKTERSFPACMQFPGRRCECGLSEQRNLPEKKRKTAGFRYAGRSPACPV